MIEARLVVVGGKANKSEVKLKLPAMIGRGRDSDVTVAHATVSRHHCLIYELEGALVVRDNGSLNGTVVDGQRIKEALLKPGQSLTIGPLTFRAEYEHNGDFPELGARPSAAAESNGEAGKPHAPSKPAKPEPAAFTQEEEDDTVQAPGAAVKAVLPEVKADKEPADDQFDFLNDDEPAATSSSSAPSFSFLKDSQSAAEDDNDDSAEIFRIADEPAEDKKPAAKSPAAKSSASAKPAEKKLAAVEKGGAKAGKGDEDALNDFLDSLGLEE